MPSPAPEPIPAAFRVHPADNVATLLGEGTPGPLPLLGAGAGATVTLAEPIALGHKVALAPIAAGAAIVKFGVRIGHATRAIPAGAWVHLHNCASDLDERSGTLDPVTGAPTDTRYV